MKVEELIVELQKLIPGQEVLLARYPDPYPVRIQGLRAETKWYLSGALLPDGGRAEGGEELQFTLLVGHKEAAIDINWDEYKKELLETKVR